MLGMIGIIIQNNVIKNTTQVLQEVKLGEKYLVRFLNPPQFSRVVNIDEMQSWLLFQTQEEADNWVKTSSQPPPALPSVTPGPAAGPNGAGDSIPGSEPDPNAGKGDETETPAIVPAEPVTKESMAKALEPDISGGKDPEDDKTLNPPPPGKKDLPPPGHKS